MNSIADHGGWSGFLKKYAVASGAQQWPGRPGASEEQLLSAEKRLKVRLPPSYMAFLSVSNGWYQVSHSVPVLRAVEDVRWFRREHPDWVKAYAEPTRGMDDYLSPEQEYFNYAKSDSTIFDVKHLAHALCLSDVGDDAVILLNPMAVWPDGEWETWFFANWLPGAVRYRSFAEWMRQELHQILHEPFEHAKDPDELPVVYLDPPNKEIRRIRPREPILILEQVLKKLVSKKNGERVKAARQLSRLGGTTAVDDLLNVLKNDPNPDVRCEAAKSLGRIAAPESVEALISAIEDTGVNSTAIHALSNFNDERSAQCLLLILEKGQMYATSAIHPLALRGEVRAIKHLLDYLMDIATQRMDRRRIGDISGRFISKFEAAGYAALEPLLDHPDVTIRGRVELGICDLACGSKEKTVRSKAYKLLQRRLEVETDSQLRRRLEISIKVAGGKNQ